MPVDKDFFKTTDQGLLTQENVKFSFDIQRHLSRYMK